MGLGGGLRDGGGGAGSGRFGLLGGSDVRAVRGVCGGPGRGQHGGGVGGIVRLCGRGSAGGAVRVQLAGAVRGAWCGFGAATVPWSRRAWASTDRRVGRFRRACRPVASTRRCGRDVRSADAVGDPELADIAGGRALRATWTARRCRRCGRRRWGSRRSDSGSVPARRRPRSSLGPAAAGDHEQHEPCGVRGVSAPVPERGVQRTGRGPSVGVGVAGGGGWWAGGCRRSRVSGAPASGTSAVGDARRGLGDLFRDCAECPEMVVLAGGGLALGPLRVDGGRVLSVRDGDGGRRG